ncbi:STAS domain-containing protein [Cryptosporangium phraense]|uniref:STAS domain-containing protein n=1 Tax=Cryptosporangium phraense TaxID=2593070 RepID=A0A545ALD4_9ACTN|nr:STAS domain-containing protein [Cryptosporangium phraense]TQS42138.1 STAS domain-containing protein [Cryptosporangium phraense]
MHTGRPESLLRCALRTTGDRFVVAGEIDEANASALGERLYAQPVATLDLANVTFFSAAGLRVLLTLGPIACAEGVVVDVHCSPPVWRILELCDCRDVPGLRFVRGAER